MPAPPHAVTYNAGPDIGAKTCRAQWVTPAGEEAGKCLGIRFPLAVLVPGRSLGHVCGQQPGHP